MIGDILWGLGCIILSVGWFAQFWVRYRLVRQIHHEMKDLANKMEQSLECMRTLEDRFPGGDDSCQNASKVS